MKLLAVIFIAWAALFSQGDCYGYDYDDDFGMRGYHSDYFEPETRAMMLDEPQKKKMGGFRPLHISSTTRPQFKLTPLKVTERPKLTLKTFKPFTKKTAKPLTKTITARPLKQLYKKPPPPPKLKPIKPAEENAEDEEE
ncbi:hypothetical protein Ocin01_10797 [Orchesella cincta]|uniref:Uncharacterized protein n=1 Tax=Orchesella cincta TaxID=48709 RepID=A0A1D2MT63_ORCCI|nr:hypothetical protein Ocin01_10797 [Orchesella cincta]